MSLIWAYRSTVNSAFTYGAYHTFADPTPLNHSQVDSTALASAIGGQALSLSKLGYTQHPISWAIAGWSDTVTVSVLMRVKFDAVNVSNSMFSIQGGGGYAGGGGPMGYFDLEIDNGPSAYTTAHDMGGILINNVKYIGDLTALTTTVWHDIVYTWTGVSGANQVKVYVDGVLGLQNNYSANYRNNVQASSPVKGARRSIALGICRQDDRSQYLVNEVVVWDHVLTLASITSAGLTGNARASFYNTTALDATSYTNPGAVNVVSGVSYIFAGVTFTGSVGASTDPGVSNVVSGTQYLINGSTLTGTLSIPTPSTGLTGTCDLTGIKENIRYLLDSNNTTTSSVVDLSSNLSSRVRKVYKLNPELIPFQPSHFPYITCWIDEKDFESQDMVKNSRTAKRQMFVYVNVAGVVWRNKTTDITKDYADDECELLMENIELVLRSYDTLGGVVLSHLPDRVDYYRAKLDEETNLRAGVLRLRCRVMY